MTIDSRALTELASVFAEVCSHHRDVQPWPDRPDLDAEVRAFWGGSPSLLTDPADEEAVVASLVTRGATTTRKERLRHVISSPNW